MNEQIKDGGPAFPQAFAMSPPLDQGMTLRDYFAAKAAAGLWANQEWMINVHKATGKDPSYCIAAAAYESADAMLAAREAQS